MSTSRWQIISNFRKNRQQPRFFAERLQQKNGPLSSRDRRQLRMGFDGRFLLLAGLLCLHCCGGGAPKPRSDSAMQSLMSSLKDDAAGAGRLRLVFVFHICQEACKIVSVCKFQFQIRQEGSSRPGRFTVSTFRRRLRS